MTYFSSCVTILIMIMKADCTDDQLMKEFGERIKANRIRSGFTQEELSKQSGVAKRTIERAEKGESIQFLNLIKLLRALGYLDSLELLLPSLEKTPFEYIKSPKVEKRQRYRHAAEKKPSYGFKWGDEE